MKKPRILDESEVIKAVNRHTRDDGILDDDISCILEEIDETTWKDHKKKSTVMFGFDIVDILEGLSFNPAMSLV